jgi:DNA-binding HxlR family transcriptional regulator
MDGFLPGEVGVGYSSLIPDAEKRALSGVLLTFRYIFMESLNKINASRRKRNDVGHMVESIIGCKWSLSVLRLLRTGVNRPGEMQRRVDGLTTKVLNERLVKLARFGIIEKEIYPESPPRVEYYFTEFGRQFLEIVDVVEKLQQRLDHTDR